MDPHHHGQGAANIEYHRRMSDGSAITASTSPAMQGAPPQRVGSLRRQTSREFRQEHIYERANLDNTKGKGSFRKNVNPDYFDMSKSNKSTLTTQGGKIYDGAENLRY